ncbi:MAG: hypothetical protein ACYSWU_15750 [Planctomycetota bacterium]
MSSSMNRDLCCVLVAAIWLTAVRRSLAAGPDRLPFAGPVRE